MKSATYKGKVDAGYNYDERWAWIGDDDLVRILANNFEGKRVKITIEELE